MSEPVNNLMAQLNTLAAQGNAIIATSPPAKHPQAIEYGRAAVGHCASDTHAKRVAQLSTICPQIMSVAQVVSQGKIVGKGLETDLAVCDGNGVGVWTYIQLPGGRSADPMILKVTGLTGQELRDNLKRCGYAYYKPGQCWRTRCDGTPARGRRGNAIGAHRNALQPNGGEDE